MKIKKKVNDYIDALHHIDNKLVIITGANSGLGFEIAKIALIKGARVVMACRNIEKANAAKIALISLTGNKNIEIEVFDQSDFASVKHFAKTIENKYNDFYSLVLNAGIMFPKEVVDKDNISTVYRTNFLGAFLLLKELDDLIRNSKSERRIIIQGSLASFAHKYKKSEKFINGTCSSKKQYCLSKLCCSNLYVYYRDNNKNVNVKYLLCEPGVAATNLFNNMTGWVKKVTYFLLYKFSNNSLVGSLNACKVMCDVAANGDYYRPGQLFTMRGLPKKGIFPSKFIFPKIIEDGNKMIGKLDE